MTQPDAHALVLKPAEKDANIKTVAKPFTALVSRLRNDAVLTVLT